MKRMVSFFQYEFLRRELQYLEEAGEIAQGEATRLLSLYDKEQMVATVPKKERKPFNVVQALSMYGAILVGLGLLSFIATNWSGMSRVSQFIFLLVGLFAFYGAGAKLEEKMPKTSRSLYYIGAFFFGASIVLVGQMFHLTGERENAFLAFGLGIFPLAYYLRDRILHGVSYFSFLYFLEAKFLFADNWMAYVFLLIVPFLFVFANKVMPTYKEWKIANFVLLYQFVEMQFLFKEGWVSYLMILVLPFLFWLAKQFPKYQKEWLVLNLIVFYQFIEMQFAWKPLDSKQFPYVLTVLLPLLYYYGHVKKNRSLPLFVVHLALSFEWLGLVLYALHVENPFYVILLLFAIGMYFAVQSKRFGVYQTFVEWTGVVIHFSTALALSTATLWAGMQHGLTDSFTSDLVKGDGSSVLLSVLFGVCYIVYGLYLVKKESIVGFAIVSVFILRYYVDFSFQFLDKSLAFFMGGFVLIGLGYWFEKNRRKEAKKRGIFKFKK